MQTVAEEDVSAILTVAVPALTHSLHHLAGLAESPSRTLGG
jgi:hypothetical protein